MGKEVRQLTLHVDDTCMVMIRHSAREDDPDAVLLRGHSEAIDEGVVGFGVRAEEEPPLRATTRDHVGLTRNDGSRKRHFASSAQGKTRCEESTLVWFVAGVVRPSGGRINLGAVRR